MFFTFHAKYFGLLTVVLLFFSSLSAQESFSYLTAEQNRFVNELTVKLTTKQKIGQMTQLVADVLFEGTSYTN